MTTFGYDKPVVTRSGCKSVMLNYHKYVVLSNHIVNIFKPHGILETFSLFVISFYWL